MKRIVALLASAVLAILTLNAAPAFDPQPWIEDLDQVRDVLATRYANLEWAVFQKEADLPRLFADTKSRIESASSDAEAQAAFDRFARRLGDEHVEFVWSKARHSAGPFNGGESDVCSTLGYDAAMRAQPLAANASGYQPLSTTQSSDFPAGVISSNGRRIGVIKIGVFTPQGYPALCHAALQSLSVPADKPCDDACNDRIDSWVSDRLTNELIAQLRALKAARATVLLVDIAGNGGGTEWAEAVARMLTPIRLRSEDLEFVRGEHWAHAFTNDEASLRNFAQHEIGQDRSLLLKLADQVEERRKVALTLCDSRPLWQGGHTACSWLGKGFYGSGLLAAADPSTLRGKPWATLLFTPMEFPYEEGVWRAPLIVLVDRNVGSAASEFAAVLQDNHAAVTMGDPTGGGCGHTNGGTPTTLRNSKAILKVPDCARFRADGSNEVLGIHPDVLVGFAATEGPHLRAIRFLGKLPEAVKRALALHH
jgi:hypothetical protein